MRHATPRHATAAASRAQGAAAAFASREGVSGRCGALVAGLLCGAACDGAAPARGGALPACGAACEQLLQACREAPMAASAPVGAHVEAGHGESWQAAQALRPCGRGQGGGGGGGGGDADDADDALCMPLGFLAASGKAACELLGLAVMDGAGEEQVRLGGMGGGGGAPLEGCRRS